jgi:hypothetical protein
MFVREETVREILAEQQKQTKEQQRQTVILAGIAELLTADPEDPERDAHYQALVLRLKAIREHMVADVAANTPTTTQT